MSSVQVGNSGGHWVMAYLLARGCHVGLADRGHPQFDILVREGRHPVVIERRLVPLSVARSNVAASAVPPLRSGITG